jgi:hypothetical protein
MRTKKILFFAGFAIAALVAFSLIRQKKVKKRTAVISEEGYETAEDILFPKRRSLRFN